jgi:hypothetical protein
VLVSPRNKELAFLKANSLLFKHLYYKGYLGALLGLFLAGGEDKLVLDSSKAVAMAVSFLVGQSGEEFTHFRNDLLTASLYYRVLALIGASNHETSSWNVFTLLLLVEGSEELPGFLLGQIEQFAALLQHCLAFINEGSLLEKTIRL